MDRAMESKSSASVEYVATKDFFHRHTRTVFWLLEYLVPFGNNVVVRWLFGWTFPPKSSLIKWLKGMVRIRTVGCCCCYSCHTACITGYIT